MTWRGSILVPVVIALATGGGCDRQHRYPAEGSTIALIGQDPYSSRWPAVTGGARKKMGDVPYFKLVTLATERDTIAHLDEAIDKALAAKPVAICFFITDPQRAERALDRLRKNAIPLVTLGRAPDELPGAAHVGPNPTEAAEQLGAALAVAAPDRASFVLVHAGERDVISTRSYERFRAATRAQRALTLLDERQVTDSAGMGPAIEELVRTFPHVGLVVTLDARVWESSQPRFSLGDRHLFATLSAAPVLWPRVRSGEAAVLVGPLDGVMAAEAIELAIEAATTRLRQGTMRHIPCEVVTADTLDDFAERYAESADLVLGELLPPEE
jgi:ABC-type sugar transport system substrate-binding protein